MSGPAPVPFCFSEKPMLKKISYLLPLAVLGACAYAIDGSVQEVEFKTPGATNSACNVYVEGLKHRVKPPQRINIAKSKEYLVVDCMAPGNRRKVVYIEPQIETSTAWNAANAGTGVAWDYASGALFRYPDVIEVNFTDTPVQDPPPPAQNAPDIKQPEEYYLEEFSPGSPRLNKDKSAPPVEIMRRGGTVSAGASTADDGTSAFSEPTYSGGDKGNLMSVIQGLEGDMNPSQSAGESGPIPLIPGE